VGLAWIFNASDGRDEAKKADWKKPFDGESADDSQTPAARAPANRVDCLRVARQTPSRNQIYDRK
jgi:hypothetical protein